MNDNQMSDTGSCEPLVFNFEMSLLNDFKLIISYDIYLFIFQMNLAPS